MNRSNAGRVLFTDAEDYSVFLRAMEYAHAQLPMRVLGFCLMPDHFHLVLWPHQDGDLSRWMHGLTSTHVRRYHQRYQSSGHIWEGRFRAFPVAADAHLRELLRFVERNPIRSGLVNLAEEWAWSSAGWWQPDAGSPAFASVGPSPRGHDWPTWVNTEPPATEHLRILENIRRSRPLGDAAWTLATAERMGLEPTLRPRGRPRGRSLADCETRNELPG